MARAQRRKVAPKHRPARYRIPRAVHTLVHRALTLLEHGARKRLNLAQQQEVIIETFARDARRRDAIAHAHCIHVCNVHGKEKSTPFLTCSLHTTVLGLGVNRRTSFQCRSLPSISLATLFQPALTLMVRAVAVVFQLFSERAANVQA